MIGRGREMKVGEREKGGERRGERERATHTHTQMETVSKP